MTADIVLVLVLAGGFMLGFFRGLVRQALVVGAWFVLFVAAAYVRIPVGEWLASSASNFSLDYASMLAYLALFFGLFRGALALIELGRGASLMRAATPGPGELPWLRDLQRALEESTVARLIGDLVVRPLGIIIGPLLPPPVRSVMA